MRKTNRILIPKSFLLWAALPSTLQASLSSSANSFLGGCIWTVISKYLLQTEKPNTLEIGHWSRTSNSFPALMDLPLSYMLEPIHLHIFCHSSPGKICWGRTVRSPDTHCPLQARWGWLERLAAWLESAWLCRNPLTWQMAVTDQSRLKSQRVFEVKSPEVQILAYSITCPSNINSLHQEYTYPVPQLTASHTGNFSWDKCKPLHPGCCCFCRRR